MMGSSLSDSPFERSRVKLCDDGTPDRPLGLFDATTAKDLVQGYKTAKEGEAKIIFEEVLRLIESSAKRGDETMTYARHSTHQAMLMQNLINRGFKAQVHGDQRDGEYLEIRW